MDDALAFLILPHTPRLLPSPGADTPQELPHAVHDPLIPSPFTEANALIGREDLLEQLKQQLLETRSLALYGLAGVGKTALAIALADDAEIATHFSDGVLWAGLGLHPHLLSQLHRWGTLLHVTISEKETKEHQEAWFMALQAATAARHLLLIFDDVWQAEAFEALKVGGSHCAYLLTTRFAHIAMHLVGERAVHVPELEETASLHLLTRFTPEILQHERETARALAQAVGGHPLALTLMSKYLGSNAAMGQPRRLHAALKQLHDAERRLRLQVPQAFLEYPERFPDDMEVSIRSVIAISDHHLPVEARTALRSLAVLPTKPVHLSQDVALAVTAVPLEILNLLCDSGLLERFDATHYMLHPLIADYLRLQGPILEARMRLIHYAVGLIEAQNSHPEILEHESMLLLLALDWAWELECWEELLRVYPLFIPVLFRWGWYAQAEQVLQRGSLVVAQHGNQHEGIQMLYHLSTLAHLQGQYMLARDLALEGLDLARQIQHHEKVVHLLIILGESLQKQGDYPQAETQYQAALKLARQQNDQEQISTLLKHLGVLAKQHGKYVQAQGYYEEGLLLARQLANHDLVSLFLMNLGVLATERGDYGLAHRYYQEGLSLARQSGHREHICVLLSNQGVLADAQGEYTQAEALFSEGLAMARRIGHRERISLLLLNLGVVADRQGKDKEAEALYQEGLALARQLEHRERISLFLLNLGDIALAQGHDLRAQAYLLEGLALARQLRHQQRISDLLLHLGMLAIWRGALVQAQEYLHEGLALARQLAHPQLTCHLLAAWGEVYLQQQQMQTAEAAFTEMLTLAPTGSRAIVANAQYGLARIALYQGQLDKAQELATRCYATFDQLGHRKRQQVHTLLERLMQLSEPPNVPPPDQCSLDQPF